MSALAGAWALGAVFTLGVAVAPPPPPPPKRKLAPYRLPAGLKSGFYVGGTPVRRPVPGGSAHLLVVTSAMMQTMMRDVMSYQVASSVLLRKRVVLGAAVLATRPAFESAVKAIDPDGRVWRLRFVAGMQGKQYVCRLTGGYLAMKRGLGAREGHTFVFWRERRDARPDALVLRVRVEGQPTVATPATPVPPGEKKTPATENEE